MVNFNNFQLDNSDYHKMFAMRTSNFLPFTSLHCRNAIVDILRVLVSSKDSTNSSKKNNYHNKRLSVLGSYSEVRWTECVDASPWRTPECETRPIPAASF